MDVLPILSYGLRIGVLGLLLRKKRSHSTLLYAVVLFSLSSLIADIISHILTTQNRNTIFMMSIYTLVELGIVLFVLLKFTFLHQKLRLVMIITSLILATLLISGMYYYGVNEPFEVIWGLSISFECIFSFLVSILIVLDLKIDTPQIPVELWVLVGIFIYTTFSIVPLASFKLRLYNADSELGATIYEIFIVTGNVFKDICFGIYALLLARKGPRWTTIQ